MWCWEGERERFCALTDVACFVGGLCVLACWRRLTPPRLLSSDPAEITLCTFPCLGVEEEVSRGGWSLGSAGGSGCGTEG